MVDVRALMPSAGDDEQVATMRGFVDAARIADGADPLDEADHLQLTHDGLTGSTGWMSAGGFAWLHPSAGADASQALSVVVHPNQRRHGHGRALLRAALEVDPGPTSAWSHSDHPGAAALADEFGFSRVRELRVMTRPTTRNRPLEAPELTPRATEGDSSAVRVRSWRDGDAAELLRVNAAAFAHHPEQGALDATGLAQRMAEPWFDPAGLLLAEDADGRLLGFHWTKVHPGGHGEVYVLGIDPAAQGQGLGRLLTDAGLAHLAARGCPSVHLYVEATNTAALALYRGRGFTTDHTHVQYAR